MKKSPDPLVREYQTIRSVSGPLLFLEGVERISLGELVLILMPNGEERRGQVIELSEEYSVIQVLGETSGIGPGTTRVRLTESVAKMDLSLDLLGRKFNGTGVPLDAMPPVLPEVRLPIIGRPINPVAREKPDHFIQTGISTIDGLNTLVRCQKLPIFSGAGLPANEIAAQIVRQAKVPDEALEGGEGFAVVFAAIGMSYREVAFFLGEFEESGVLERTVLFLNLASDPPIERLLTPRFALTVAEYLAFTHGYHVLAVLMDMTNYCEALREISTAREEIPGRRGYPGYMYSDLATLYERAGRVIGEKGSVTQIPILTMPDDDITHPVPDLTGYITEGQIVLSRELNRKGIYPPIDVLPSLSRLMNMGIGENRTRSDHRELADQLYGLYAQARDARKMEAVVGSEGMTEHDQRLLEFGDLFEKQFIHQPHRERNIKETLGLGWELLSFFPKERLSRIRQEFIEQYYKTGKERAV